MTWKSHKLITLVVVYTITGNFIVSLIAAAGSILPDLLEGKSNWKNPKVHRTYTHWFIPYLILIILFSSMTDFSLLNAKEGNLIGFLFSNFLSQKENTFGNFINLISFVGQCLCFGCLLHIVQDALTGKVPFLNPKKKTFGLKLFKTGSPVEYVFLGLAIFVMLILGKK